MIFRFLFSLPYLVWLLYFIRFYSGRLTLLADGRSYFICINYYLAHITRGIYPLWNPFDSWGRPEIWSRFFGEFNPFYFLISVLNYAGLPIDLSYLVFLIVYFFLGVIALYLFVNRLYHNTLLSYCAMLLFLFSSIGINMFSDTVIIFLFVPCFWFFYFLVAFLQTQEQKHFLGITFTLMLIMVTYMPFYFITLFLAVSLSYLILYPIKFFKNVKKLLYFFFKNRLLTAFCTFSLIIAILPGFMWYIDGKQNDYINDSRQEESVAGHSARLSLEVINRNPFFEHATFSGLFSHLKDFGGFQLYIPLFAIIILAMGIGTRINRRMILYALIFLLLLLITLTDTTPVHKFLYEHIFYFQLFRNLHFFIPFYCTALILFVIELMKEIINFHPDSNKKKIIAIAYCLIVHISVVWFLSKFEGVIITSYLTVGLSFVFFVTYFSGLWRDKHQMLILGMFVLIVLQPLEVFYYVVKNSAHHSFSYRGKSIKDKSIKPQFSFTRPDRGNDSNRPEIGFGDWSDNSGFSDGRLFYGMRDTYVLQKDIKSKKLEEYVKYKFIVYDTKPDIAQEPLPLETISSFFASEYKTPIVSSEVLPNKSENLGSDSQKAGPTVITGNSDNFQILDFDLNSIKFKTNFNTPKFLVYNDSFHSKWRATINSDPVHLYKANMAFKGVWLPEGKNIVLFEYGARWEQYLYRFIAIYFIVFLIILSITSIPKTAKHIN